MNQERYNNGENWKQKKLNFEKKIPTRLQVETSRPGKPHRSGGGGEV